MRGLAESLEEILDEKMDEAIAKAVENFDFSDTLSEAAKEHDFSRDLERSIETGIEEELGRVDIDGKVTDAVDAELNDQLKPRMREVLLDMLKDPEVLEALTAALFDRG